MTGRIVVVGLGPGGADQITVGALSAMSSAGACFVRTAQHPSSALAVGATSFDDIYDSSATLEEVYATIVERLLAAADHHEVVCYAVPGSPLVAERTVELLRAQDRVEVEVTASLSFLDLAWARLGVDPISSGVRLVDGHRFALEAAGHVGPMLVAQVDSSVVCSSIKLAVDDGPTVTVLQRLGLPDEEVRTLPWADLDREVTADPLTCVWIPTFGVAVAAEMVALEELVRTLRARCPWDQAQTHGSLTRHLLEESYEVVEAIGELSPTDPEPGYEHLEEELGDVLFQVYLHAALAAEAGRFTVADVARGVHDKLVSRHPHVFAGASVEPGALGARWEEIKKLEKGRASVMDGIPGHLPALLLASKVQRKAASQGFDWSDVVGAWEKIAEELSELAQAMADAPTPPPPGGADAVIDELGDVLFSVVNVARHLEVDPEAALHRSAEKFRRRFMAVEARIAARPPGSAPLDAAGWDELWEEVKRAALVPESSATVNTARHPSPTPRDQQDP